MSSAVISLPAFLKRNRPLDGEVLGSKAPNGAELRTL